VLVGPAATRTASEVGRLNPECRTRSQDPGRSPDGADADLLRSASCHLGDIALRFRTLFRRLGQMLDGTGGFDDADAWYCILEGTSEIAVAEAQARALVDILASYITHGPGGEREILLAVDEFSAVSRRLPIWQLYERARSLGLAVQVSAQSRPGVAPRDDDRYRIAAAADGGIWLLRTPHPRPPGRTGRKPPVSRYLPAPARGRVMGPPGSSRVRDEPVADPAIIRRLDTGQAAYIHRGGVTFIQIKRLIAAPAALTAQPVAAGPPPAARERATGHAALAYEKGRRPPPPPPDAGALLDEAFGGEPG
jgi:hypothetical protein